MQTTTRFANTTEIVNHRNGRWTVKHGGATVGHMEVGGIGEMGRTIYDVFAPSGDYVGSSDSITDAAQIAVDRAA